MPSPIITPPPTRLPLWKRASLGPLFSSLAIHLLLFTLGHHRLPPTSSHKAATHATGPSPAQPTSNPTPEATPVAIRSDETADATHHPAEIHCIVGIIIHLPPGAIAVKIIAATCPLPITTARENSLHLP